MKDAVSLGAYISKILPPEPLVTQWPRPEYDPDIWNKKGVVEKANCYAYALQSFDTYFPQIGDRARLKRLIEKGANTLHRRFNKAVADGLIPAPFNNAPDVKGYYQVALVNGKGWHWYRKDANSLWSHKDGDKPCSDLDDMGNVITDPKFCATIYPEFVSYFYVPNRGLHF